MSSEKVFSWTANLEVAPNECLLLLIFQAFLDRRLSEMRLSQAVIPY